MFTVLRIDPDSELSTTFSSFDICFIKRKTGSKPSSLKRREAVKGLLSRVPAPVQVSSENRHSGYANQNMQNLQHIAKGITILSNQQGDRSPSFRKPLHSLARTRPGQPPAGAARPTKSIILRGSSGFTARRFSQFCTSAAGDFRMEVSVWRRYPGLDPICFSECLT